MERPARSAGCRGADIEGDDSMQMSLLWWLILIVILLVGQHSGL